MLLSLKSKLLATISVIVILTGLAIAGIVTQRYSGALRQEMMGQSESLAHGIALDAADRILINDLVGLQKMLDQQRRIHPTLAYLFILKDGQVLAHTFDQGLPAGLLEANQPISPAKPGFRQVVRKRGTTTWIPLCTIFEGKAGILRWDIPRAVTGPWSSSGGRSVQEPWASFCRRYAAVYHRPAYYPAPGGAGGGDERD